MVRRLNVRSWKAALCLLAAGAVLMAHILACTESPMAFSPDGKTLAFVTLSPYDEPYRGESTFRLMALGDKDTLTVIEETNAAMLTAPAYSPDGKQIAYFRIPLATREQSQSNAQAIANRQERLVKALSEISRTSTQPATTPAAPTSQTAAYEDHALPSLLLMQDYADLNVVADVIPMELVLRSTSDYRILRTIGLEITGMGHKAKDLAAVYVLTRPRYSPDGQTVYACIANTVFGVDLEKDLCRVLAGPVITASIAPDAQHIAFIQKDAIGFARTDGSMSTYIRHQIDDSEAIYAGLVWLDAGRIALIETTEDQSAMPETQPAGKKVVRVAISQLPVTGDKTPWFTVPFEITEHQPSTPELALSPDGKRAVLCLGGEVVFLDGNGKILARHKARGGQNKPSELLSQPTFSPDGTRIAMKRLVENDQATQTTEIVFFSPDGKPLSRSAIPPAPTTQRAVANQ